MHVHRDSHTRKCKLLSKQIKHSRTFPSTSACPRTRVVFCFLNPCPVPCNIDLQGEKQLMHKGSPLPPYFPLHVRVQTALERSAPSLLQKAWGLASHHCIPWKMHERMFDLFTQKIGSSRGWVSYISVVVHSLYDISKLIKALGNKCTSLFQGFVLGYSCFRGLVGTSSCMAKLYLIEKQVPENRGNATLNLLIWLKWIIIFSGL